MRQEDEITMMHLKQLAAVAIVAVVAGGVASGATYAATTGTAGAKACVTSSGILKLVNGNGSCPSGSSPAVLGAQGPAGPAGATILSGAVPPASNIGIAGDYYIDTATHFIYGPASHHCLPLPCATQWGKGTSLTGPTGPAGAAGAEATAYQSSHESEMPNGQATDIATLPLVTAGYYTITATVNAEHSGNDTTTWSCSLLGAEPDGNTQNYVESDTSLQGNGAASNVTLPLVAGVEVVAGEKIVVNCSEDQAKKGDQAYAVILATKMSVIGGVFNP